MSEADRVFPARKGQGPQAPSSEKRHILSASRRSGPRAGKARMVEVVHVRRDRSRPSKDHPRPAPASQHAETWPEELQAKPAQPLPPQDIQPIVPEPVPPVVHVMPMWVPSQPQLVPPAPKSDEVAGKAGLARQRRRRTPAEPVSRVAARRFADPFADEDGANCIRCGYLVEPAREKRGLMTCSVCG
jgi:hypothetical protein